MHQKFKSEKEWEELLGTLTDDQFEEMCYHLLRSMCNFENIDWRKDGADGGRDHEASYCIKAPDKITVIRQKWRFECKCQKTGVNSDDIIGKINRAISNNISCFVVMSNKHITPDCKTEIKNLESKHNIIVMDWSGIHFQEILFQYPAVVKAYFGDETIPPFNLMHNSMTDVIQISGNIAAKFNIRLELKPKPGLVLDQTNIGQTLLELIEFNQSVFEKLDKNFRSIIYQHLGTIIFHLSKKEEGLKLTEKALELSKGNIGIMLNKAYMLEQMGEGQKAIGLYNKILESDEKNKFAITGIAHNNWVSGDFLTATEHVEQALVIDDNFINAIQTKANILKAQDKIDEALQFLNAKLKNNMNARALISTKVALQIEQIDLKGALETNQEILNLIPNDIDALNNIGVIYEHNSKYQYPEKYLPIAIEKFEIVTKMNPDYPLAWSNRFLCLLRVKNNLNEIEEAIDSLLLRFADFPQLLNIKADILRAKKDYKGALRKIDMAISIQYSESFLLCRAECLLQLRKNKETIELLESLVKNRKSINRAWELKAIAHHRLHQKHFEKICLENAKKYQRIPISLLE